MKTSDTSLLEISLTQTRYLLLLVGQCFHADIAFFERELTHKCRFVLLNEITIQRSDLFLKAS